MTNCIWGFSHGHWFNYQMNFLAGQKSNKKFNFPQVWPAICIYTGQILLRICMSACPLPKPIWPLTQNVTCRCQPESSSPKLILIHKHFSSGVLHSASFFGSSNQECVISGLWNFHFKPRRRPENGKWICWVALGFPMHRCQFLASVHSAHLLHYNESWKVNLWALWIRYWAANWIP